MIELLNFFGNKRLPVILQSEASECGLACLTMVASYHGHDVDLLSMRQRFSTSLKGMALDRMIDISAHLDLGARALRAELESLSSVLTPAILHWDLDHYVVLEKVAGNKLHIVDPARGARVMTLKEASPHFSGVVLELQRTTDFQKQSGRSKMRLSELWDSLTGLKRALVQLLILSSIIQMIVLIMPFQMQLVVDEVLVKFDHSLLLIVTVGFSGIALIHKLTSAIRGFTIMYFGNVFFSQMMSNLFRHLISLPAAYFEKRHVGDVLSRMSSTKPIQTALTESVIAGIIDGVMAITTGIVIFLYSSFLGMIVVLSLLVNFAITLAYYPTMRRIEEDLIVRSAKESTHMMETIRGSSTIRLFGEENKRLSIWRNLFADVINTGIRKGKYDIVLSTVHGLIGSIQAMLIIYFGARMVLSGDNSFTIGMLLAFVAYSASFSGSIQSLIGKLIEFRFLSLHLERLADITRTEPEISAPIDEDADEGKFNGEIMLKDVSFRYSSSDPWVLKDVNLTINPRDFIAFTGPSGGGKTTLLKLIMGMYPPTEGEILIDGKPLTQANMASWRKKVGAVQQDDRLMSGSIADNISFFDSKLDMKRVRKVARDALIHEEIMAMPMNYLSFIGDMGSALSGGQKQRIFLARAFYRRPKILCLDEGTANIDEEAERKIVDYIESMPIVRLVVAHRPEFIERAERIIYVNHGDVVEVDKPSRRGVTRSTRSATGSPDKNTEEGAAEE